MQRKLERVSFNYTLKTSKHLALIAYQKNNMKHLKNFRVENCKGYCCEIFFSVQKNRKKTVLFSFVSCSQFSANALPPLDPSPPLSFFPFIYSSYLMTLGSGLYLNKQYPLVPQAFQPKETGKQSTADTSHENQSG